MGENRLFWPQELLDEWILDEKIILEGQQLKIKSENNTYQVTQALYFQSDVGDGQDAYNLLGRVKELSTIEEMGGEHYMDSVLIADSAYKVIPGFTGTPLVETTAVSTEYRSKDISGALSTQPEDPDAEKDRELLARFLIENL